MKKLFIIFSLFFIFCIVSYGQAVQKIRNNLRVMDDVTIDSVLSVSDGTVSLPSITLTSDPNTGIYTTGADILNITAGGVIAASFVEATTTQALFGDGTQSLPSISFISDPDLGFYNLGSNSIAVAISGSLLYRFESLWMGSSASKGGRIANTSSATIPFIYGSDDTNTGIGRAGADISSHIAGGKEGIRIDGVVGGIEVYLRDTTIFDNGAYLSNEETDTLKITETVTKIEGNLAVTGNLEVAGTESYYGSMYFANNAVAQVMETVNTPIAVKNYTQGSLNGFTFDAGSTGAITAYADYGVAAGDTVTVTAVGHGLTDNDYISIRGTTNYNGIWQIGYIDADNFYIVDTWVADDGASDWEEPSHLIASQGSSVKFDAIYTLGASEAGGAGSTFIWKIYVNSTIQAETIIHSKFANNDVGALAGCGTITVSSGDWVYLTVESTGTNNITHSYGCLRIKQD